MTTGVASRCPHCQAPVEPGHRFCEECGGPLTPDASLPPPPAPGAVPAGEEIGGLGPTGDGQDAPLPALTAGRHDAGPPRRPGVVVTEVDLEAVPTRCAACPGSIDPDGYCTTCGTPAVRPRDHYVEQPAAWVAMVCDRGVRHTVNQDAGAIAASVEPGVFAALVICDGVSSAARSEVASLGAARAARDVLAAPRPFAVPPAPPTQPIALPAPDDLLTGPPPEVTAGSTSVQSRSALLAAAVREAGAAAQLQAAAAASDPPERNPPACTFVAAALAGSTVVVGWVGDSRAYWLPDDGVPLQLSTDDSWAAEAIAAGYSRREAEQAPQAHSITRWLGLDAPDAVPRTAARRIAGAGWLLLCSDGLWNYRSEAADLHDLVIEVSAASGPEPRALAEALVSWAIGQGGHDNITVALARVDQVG